MKETKKCKYCQTEIDAKAKICPNCKKKQGGKGKIVAIVVVVLVIIAIIGGLGSEDDKPKTVAGSNSSGGNTSTQGSVETTAEKATFGIGETVELKGVQATLVSVTENNGSEYNKPEDGNVFVLCEFNIENNSDSDISVSSIMSFEAYCDSYSLNQSLTGLLTAEGKNQLDGSVASGKKMAGVIAYEVPSDWSELEISFTPSFWSGKDITFIATK